MARASVLAIVCLLVTLSGGSAAERTIVFAAASTADALDEVVAGYLEQAGNTEDLDIRVVNAASSTLARQIAAGAPANIYLSANQAWMTYLVDRKLVDGASLAPLLGNALVLIVPEDSLHPANTTVTADDLVDLSRMGRIAIGDPSHVPAGIYARQALQFLEIWPYLQDRLATTADVRAALALVARGEVAAGIVYRSDTVGRKSIRVIGTFPTDSHQSIDYPVALIEVDQRVNDASQANAKLLLDFMRSDPARSVFERHGFTVVGTAGTSAQ